MQYSRLVWAHDSPTEPVEIWSEYDEDSWECRKVEYFHDGSVGFADGPETAGGVEVSLIQRPGDEKVAADPEFRVLSLTGEEFDKAWGEARRALRVPHRIWE